jgi:hypothetical protein
VNFRRYPERHPIRQWAEAFPGGHAVAGDLGLSSSTLHQALHARDMLTIGISQAVEPIHVQPTANEVCWIDSSFIGKFRIVCIF